MYGSAGNADNLCLFLVFVTNSIKILYCSVRSGEGVEPRSQQGLDLNLWQSKICSLDKNVCYHDTYRYRIHHSKLTRSYVKGADRSKTKPGKLREWTRDTSVGQSFPFPRIPQLSAPVWAFHWRNARTHVFTTLARFIGWRCLTNYNAWSDTIFTKSPGRLTPSAQGEMCEQSHPTLTDHIVHHLHPKCKHGDDTPRCTRWVQNLATSSSELSTLFDVQRETVSGNMWSS